MSLDFSLSFEELEAAQSATTNPYLRDPGKGLQLIASLVGQPRPNVGKAQRQQLPAALHRLINERFIELTSKGSFPGEAQALRELQALEASLENLALFPDLANKTVVGVGVVSAPASRACSTPCSASICYRSRWSQPRRFPVSSPVAKTVSLR